MVELIRQSCELCGKMISRFGPSSCKLNAPAQNVWSELV